MKLRKTISIVLALAMGMTLITAVPAMAKTKGALVKSVTYYYYDTSSKKWELSSRTNYTYEKANPVTREVISYSGDSLDTTRYKYKFRGGKKRKSMKRYNSINRYDAKYSYDKKGFLVKGSEWDRKKQDKDTYIFKNDSKGFVKQFTYKNVYTWKNSEGKKQTEKNEYTYTYDITKKKGLPSKVISYRKNDDGSKYASSVTYFNGSGLITKAGYPAVDSTPEDITTVIKYKNKKGKVATAIVYDVNDGKQEQTGKYVFKYTKEKIDAARYSSMINATLNGYNRRYIANWY